MDRLILGLLLLKDLTVYEIQAFLRQGMGFLYSDSMGSIQAAIKKLLGHQQVVFVERVENGKNKKIYSITDIGKKSFTDWLSQPVQAGAGQDRILTRLFFMGLLPADQRKPLILSHIAVLQGKLVTLQSSWDKAEAATPDSGHEDVSFFQAATIRFAIEAAQFEAAWYTALLSEMETNPE